MIKIKQLTVGMIAATLVVAGASFAAKPAFATDGQSSQQQDLYSRKAFFKLFDDIQPVPQKAETGNPDIVNKEAMENILKPNTDYAVTVATVKLDNVSFDDLYNFTGDLRNDASWFPAVTNVTRLNGDGGLGSNYSYTFDFGGFLLTNNVELIEFSPQEFRFDHSTGPFPSDGLVTWQKVDGGSEYTIYGALPLGPGITFDQVKGLIAFSYSNLLHHFNTTGTITVNGSVKHVN